MLCWAYSWIEFDDGNLCLIDEGHVMWLGWINVNLVSWFEGKIATIHSFKELKTWSKTEKWKLQGHFFRLDWRVSFSRGRHLRVWKAFFWDIEPFGLIEGPMGSRRPLFESRNLFFWVWKVFWGKEGLFYGVKDPLASRWPLFWVWKAFVLGMKSLLGSKRPLFESRKSSFRLWKAFWGKEGLFSRC